MPSKKEPKLPTGLSPSSFGTWNTCPRKFEEEKIRGLFSPPGLEAMLGTFVHRILELLMQRPPEERTLEVAKECARQAWPETENHGSFKNFRLADDQKKKFRWDAWTSVENYFEMEPPEKVEVIATERNVKCELNGVPIRGIIDRLDREEAGLVVSDYKGLALDTELPTPQGWVSMRAVQKGDELLGADGRPCLVVEKSEVHHRPCFKITFDDGSSVIADNEHLWSVDTDYGPEVFKTEELTANLFNRNKKAQKHLRITNAQPLDLKPQEFPLDPWILGYWLGNGRKTSGEISWGKDPTVVEVIESRGYSIGSINKTTGDNNAGTILKIRGTLGKLGLLDNKHVPSEYLRGSFEQRLDLLRGLMDSDGSWNPLRNQAIFVNLNRDLAEAVYELVVSLGWRASWWEGRGFGFGKEVHQIKVSFRPETHNPFLTRGGREADLTGTVKSRRRLIMAVEEIESVPTACVTVDSPGSLYLCGRQMVPTHNSGKLPNPKYPEDKLNQMNIYAGMIEAIEGERPIVGRLIFTAHSTIVPVEYSDASVALVQDKLKAAWETLHENFEATDFTKPSSQSAFKAKTGPLCGWCPAVGHCPEGKAFVTMMHRKGMLAKHSPAYASITGGAAKVVNFPKRRR